ncbi:alpha/beta fold hydrolase [Rhizobacter sp. Root1221]|uniref:alpha/beta fold hydrolase n=1 Tax=Rhizobacter sp. Root1221 TaxID=1736433 RepID=UPI0006F34731|nr:alpha/beta hydrolase [Rhizobacter sp. Root1221]KQV94722.1 alpha/beta hydrolase [Rhizobacter sp. Root1221]
MKPSFVTVDWEGQPVSIEYAWISHHRERTPLLVFLHEGLGSRAMWKDFPQQLCDAAGCRGLVYSRPGYGKSTPRAPGDAWGLDFMHRQAEEVLPALLRALDVDTQGRPPWLFGHSDGASIALLHAVKFPNNVGGVVVLAPHLFVEDLTVENIEKARTAYQTTDLRQRLAKYHDDPDSAFWGWNDIWLHPPFKAWSIEHEIAAIRCPVLAVQGLDDEYGTLAQIHHIARELPRTQLLELPHCGHSPHRDQPKALIDATVSFLHLHTN